MFDTENFTQKHINDCSNALPVNALCSESEQYKFSNIHCDTSMFSFVYGTFLLKGKSTQNSILLIVFILNAAFPICSLGKEICKGDNKKNIIFYNKVIPGIGEDHGLM